MAERRLLTTGAPERNSTSPRAVAVGEAVAAPVVAVGLVALVAGLVAVAAGLVAEAARVVAAELAPGVPVGRLELGAAPLEVVVRERQVPGRAPAAVGPEPALLRGRPALVAGPGLLEEEPPGDQELEPLGRRELEVPGSDPGHPVVAEVREPHPPRGVRVARMLSPCLSSSGPISLQARSSRRRLARTPCYRPRRHREFGRPPSC